MPWTIKELADLSGGRVYSKPSALVTGFRPVEDATDGDLTFVTDSKWLRSLKKGAAAVVAVGLESEAGDRPIIVADNPRLAFARILGSVMPEVRPAPGVHEKAVVDKNAETGKDVHIGPLAYVGPGARIGDRSVLHPGAHVGPNSVVGSDCVLHPHSYLGHSCRLGDRVVLGPGSSIGHDGFGYQWDGTKHVKIPQVGVVVIEDDVEIGALSAVDRAMIGETRIGAGTKIDNLVMVAHNCKIGRNAILVAQVGLAGSVTIEDGVILAGQVGVSHGLKIGAGAIAGGQAGIAKDVPKGKRVGGTPARNEITWLRSVAMAEKLPELLKRIKQLEEKVGKLEKK